MIHVFFGESEVQKIPGIGKDVQQIELKKAAIIGEVVPDHPGMVSMKTKIGGTRIVDMLSGEQLPRIC